MNDLKIIILEIIERSIPLPPLYTVDNPTQKALKRVDLDNDDFFTNCPNIVKTNFVVTGEDIGFGPGLSLNADRKDFMLKARIKN